MRSLRPTVTGAADLLADFLAGVALHPPDGDGAELVVLQRLEQLVVFLGDLHGELGRRLIADDVVETRLAALIRGAHHRAVTPHGAAPSLLGGGAFQLFHGAAHGDGQQQAPEVVAVVQIGKAAVAHAFKKAHERRVGDVGPAHHAPRGG